jgi:competence protein ComEC
MDEIKRKLAQIDAEVHRRSLYARAVEAAPLLFPATGLMVGVVCQEIISPQGQTLQPTLFVWLWATLLTISTAALAVARVRASKKWWSPSLGCGVLVCFVCLGAIRLISFNRAGANDIRYAVGNEQVLATVRGRVVTEPHAGEPRWCFGALTFEDPSSRFYLSLDALKGKRGWTAATGTIHVHVDEPTPNLKPGDHITAECWLHRFAPPSNPGQFDIARHLARTNVYAGAAVPSRDCIKVDDSTGPDWWSRMRSRMSQMAAQALLGDAHIDDPDEGLVQALLLGNREDIDSRAYEAFRRTGLLHLVSLSGMHFAMLIVMIWWVCRIVGLSKRGRALVGIVAAALFLMVVPTRAPTVRAAIMVWAYCASILAGRRVRSLNSLCLAAIILLLIRPTQVFEVGWQLSFGCMAGIIALTNWPSGYMHDQFLNKPKRDASRAHLVMHLPVRVSSHAFGLFRVGLAAWIGGAGILLYHFHTITPLTSFWTVLTFPLVWLIMMTGFLQILLAFLLPTISLLLGDLGQAIAHVFIAVVRVMATPDINLLLVGRVGLWVVAFYYSLVLFWLFGPAKRPRLKQWLGAAALLLIVGHLGILKWQRTHRDELRMTCLDVGHGQAILVQLPGSRNVLFDAGSLYKRDIGSRIVVPFLDYAGVGTLDAIVISHGDVDHVNGIPEIVDHCRIGHVYAAETFLATAPDKRAARLLQSDLADKGYTIEPLPRRMDSGPAVVQTLWPPPEPSATQALSDNDRSAVSLIQLAGLGVLLCSDIESAAQRRIMAQNGGLQAQVVTAPHHGSITTTEEGFLSHFHPRFVVCSCGRREHGSIGTEHETLRNPPRPAIPEWFHTSIHGATFICIDRNGMVEVSCHLNHESIGE